MKLLVAFVVLIGVASFFDPIASAQARGVLPATESLYATEAELAGAGLPHLLDLSMGLAYARTLEPTRTNNFENAITFRTRTRLLLGDSVAFCTGLDAELGGVDSGFVGSITGYLIGGALRWASGNAISLCGGVGVDGAVGSIPVAARFPVELSLAQELGPLRVVVWFRTTWLAGAPARTGGSTWTTAFDEVEAGFSLRLGAQRSYWATTSAGGGASVGFAYRELMGTRSLGFTVGLDLSGAQ